MGRWCWCAWGLVSAKGLRSADDNSNTHSSSAYSPNNSVLEHWHYEYSHRRVSQYALPGKYAQCLILQIKRGGGGKGLKRGVGEVYQYNRQVIPSPSERTIGMGVLL